MTNYFDFFNLPVSPRVDQAQLKKTFYANSRRFHPDFHTLADGQTQDDSLEQSTLNNKGYKVLKDDDQRLRHLLELHDALGEEGSNKMPQAFLMEMMDLNETLMELRTGGDPALRGKVDAMINDLEGHLRSEVHELLHTYDDATATPEQLAKLKDYYLKRRYLRRLREQTPEV